MILIAVLIITGISGNLFAFEQALVLFDMTNPTLNSQSQLSPNGNKVLLYQMNLRGRTATYLDIYDPDNISLLPQPLEVAALSGNSVFMTVNEDNLIAIIRCESVDSYYEYRMDIYDAGGNLVTELSDRMIMNLYDHYPWSFTIRSDGLGGFHCILISTRYRIYYQHVDAAGNIAQGLGALLLASTEQSSWNRVVTTEDHGVLICYRARNENNATALFIAKIGQDHQLAWHKEYMTLSEQSNWLEALQGPQNSTYMIAYGYLRGLSVNRIDHDGNPMWDTDWQPQSIMDHIFQSATVNAAGRLILHYRRRPQGGEPYQNYFIELNEWAIPYFEVESVIAADHLYADPSGGWYIVETDAYQMTIQHYNSLYQCWPQAVTIDHMGDAAPFLAGLLGDDLDVTYQRFSDNFQTIQNQRVTASGIPAYPEGSAALIGGRVGEVDTFKTLALPDGRLFCLWRQKGIYDGYISKRLMCRIVKPDGSTLHEEALLISHQGLRMDNINIFAVSDQNVLLTWRMPENPGGKEFYAQLVDINSGPLWGESGRLLHTGPELPLFDYYDGSLYMARYDGQDEIRLHRYVNGYAVWGVDGLCVGKRQTEHAGATMSLSALKHRHVAWTLRSFTDTAPWTFSFLNVINARDQLRYGLGGMQISEATEQYLGVELAEIREHGSELLLVLRNFFRRYEHEGGHSSSSYWYYYWHSGFGRIHADGSMSFSSSITEFENKNPVSVSPDAIYFTSSAWATSLSKYDFTGTQLWEVSFPMIGYISRLHLMPDERIRLLIGSWQYQVTTAIMNQDGDMLEWPVALIENARPEELIQTEHGLYIVGASVTASGVTICGMVQYLEHQPWSEPDPQSSPALFSMSQNFPNPFRTSTLMQLDIREAGKLSLKVYNIRGQLVRTILNGETQAGNHSFVWDGLSDAGKPCAAGVYILKAETPKGGRTKKALKLP